MKSNFSVAMEDYTTTLNGAISLTTPDISGESKGRISLFYKAIRGIQDSKLYEYLRDASKENLIDVFLIVFNIRDCRGGKGERDIGRLCIIWLFLNYPNEFDKVAELLPEYGRWDDLMELWPCVLDLSNLEVVREKFYSNIEDEKTLSQLRNRQKKIVSIMAKQLVKDRAAMINKEENISLCAKWAPSEHDSYDKKHGVVSTLCVSLGVSFKKYRKNFITPLRSYIDIVEKKMCEKKWDDINFNKVPSCAMKRLKQSFEKNAEKKFSDWKTELSNRTGKVNAKQLYPHELIKEIRTKKSVDIVCEAQWEVLEKNVETLGLLQNTLFVCDVSPSMDGVFKSVRPMDVAIALSLIGANAVKGEFHNHIITFHDSPSFEVIRPGSLYKRYNQIINAPWGISTNLQATFDLILNKAKKHNLKQEDMPTNIIIISDMQFDRATTENICEEKTNYQCVKDKYEASGYKKPHIVFWNVSGMFDDFPTCVTEKGTSLISGFSPSILQSIIDGDIENITPYGTLRKTIDIARLERVRIALKE